MIEVETGGLISAGFLRGRHSPEESSRMKMIASEIAYMSVRHHCRQRLYAWSGAGAAGDPSRCAPPAACQLLSIFSC